PADASTQRRRDEPNTQLEASTGHKAAEGRCNNNEEQHMNTDLQALEADDRNGLATIEARANEHRDAWLYRETDAQADILNALRAIEGRLHAIAYSLARL